MDFTHKGIPCSTRIVPALGCINGYISVPPGHPWHGKHYDEIKADVHGGLTYSGDHVPTAPHPEAPADSWVVGFDTAHAGDLVPKLRATSRDRERWPEHRVADETRHLADQAAAAK